jgi:hypothetical protein
MKKKDAINAVFKLLDDYQDCRLTKKLAEEIIDKLTNIGMLPPDYIVENYDGTQSYTYKNKWEEK